MDLTSALPALAIMLAFSSAALVAGLLFDRLFAAAARARRVDRRLTAIDGRPAEAPRATRLLRRSLQAGGEQSPDASPWRSRLERRLALAGLTLTPEQVVTGVALATLGFWLLGLMVGARSPAASPFAGGLVSLAAAFALAATAAWLWTGSRIRRRLLRLDAQLPIALDIIVRSLRAGHPVVSALQLAAAEAAEPLRGELSRVVEATAYGADLRDALTLFARRCRSSDAHFFAVSVRIQSETGGNLAEVLDGLATVIRGRSALAQKVKALSSEGRASALLMSLAPIGLLALQLVIHSGVYSAKAADPLFWPIAGAAVGLYVMGWLSVRRIIRFRY